MSVNTRTISHSLFKIVVLSLIITIIVIYNGDNCRGMNRIIRRLLGLDFDPKTVQRKPIINVIKSQKGGFALAQHMQFHTLDRASPIISQNYHYSLIHGYGFELCVAESFSDCQALYDDTDKYYLLNSQQFIGKSNKLENFNKSFLTNNPAEWYPTTPYELAIFRIGPQCLKNADVLFKLISVWREYNNPSILFDGLERGPSYPFITGDGFRHMCKFRCSLVEGCNFQPLDIEDSHQCVFLEGGNNAEAFTVSDDSTKVFIDTILPELEFPVTLVSHNNRNNEVTLSGEGSSSFFNHDKVKHWFTANCNWQNDEETEINMKIDREVVPNKPEKVTCLPIGIENRYVGRGVTYSNYFDYMKPEISVNSEKSLLLLASSTPQQKYDYEFFANDDFAFVGQHYPDDYKKHFAEMDEYQFIFFSHHDGLSHPTLLELLFRCQFPLVQKSTMDSQYKGLPVLIVDKLEDVSSTLLEKAYDEFIHSLSWRMDRLFFSYWEALILRKMIM